MTKTRITRYGNSLAVRLPAALVREIDLREGDDVEVRREFSALIIERAPVSRLEMRLATVREPEAEIGHSDARGAEIIE